MQLHYRSNICLILWLYFLMLRAKTPAPSFTVFSLFELTRQASVGGCHSLLCVTFQENFIRGLTCECMMKITNC